MADTLSHAQIQQFKQVLKEVLDEKMSWNISEKLSNIENNLDKFLRSSRADPNILRKFNTPYTSLKK
jgi:hypothetical protein